MDAPDAAQPEINIFGPGYGESCVIHVGSGEWIIIDSCLNSEKRPAALAYLESIGVAVESAVKLIVATHWHDDHIRGLADTLECCKSAKFCTSSAMQQKEFVIAIHRYEENHGTVAGSGAREFKRILEILVERKPAKPMFAASNRRILFREGAELAHGLAVEMWSLSPSDGQFQLFLADIGNLIPKQGEGKRRAPSQGPNHLSIATLVKIGDYSFLFGADLEEVGDPELGWSAVVGSGERPSGKSAFFKVPHHGSETGHHEETWDAMIERNAIAVLTPWNRNKGLPTLKDVERILKITEHGYSTSDLSQPKTPPRDIAVRKQISETTVSFSSYEPNGGHIRLRPRFNHEGGWCVDLFNHSCALSKLLNVLQQKEAAASRAAAKKIA